MRRLLLLGSLALVGLPALPAAAATGTPGATSTPPPRHDLTAFHCRRALDPTGRSVSVRAVMRPVKGTRALSLRFDLLRRAGGVTRSLRGAGDLGIWLTPKDPTIGQMPGDVWQLNKAVYNLDAPASYRFRVSFRWLGRHGRVLSTAVQQTRSCRQRELRPDLLVRSVSVTAIPGRPQQQRYAAVIANAGASAAGPFQVLFTPGDTSPPQSRTVNRIDAHASRLLTFVGPVCDAGSPPTVVADSTSHVDDRDRNNNAMTVTCPALGAAARR